jgi:hypothetical protein
MLWFATLPGIAACHSRLSLEPFARHCYREVATDRQSAATEIRGEIGGLFDEIQNLVEPIKRSQKELRAAPQQGRMPERGG